MRRLTLLALIFGLWSCGGSSEDAEELKKYVESMKQLDSLNRQVQEAIARVDEPTVEMSKTDLDAARRLVGTYIDAVKNVGKPEYNDLRLAYESYLRKLELAQEQAVDTGRELTRERGNVAIALREIEKLTKRHYKSGIDLLWGRQKLEGEQPLKWPSSN